MSDPEEENEEDEFFDEFEGSLKTTMICRASEMLCSLSDLKRR